MPPSHPPAGRRHPRRATNGYGSSRPGDFPTACSSKHAGPGGRADVPSCASVYRGDARHLVRAGLIGGKGIDESVTERPAVLLTLTAPSFGLVHSAQPSGPCPPGPTAGCASRSAAVVLPFDHADHERLWVRRFASTATTTGAPCCTTHALPSCGAAPRSISCATSPARSGGRRRRRKARMKLSFCRVAEYQRRGVVHLHAVVRADGINGAMPPLSVEQLARAAVSAARAVWVAHASGVARWGNQIDVQVLDRSAGRWAQKVAGYVAKYATKSSDGGGALDCRIRLRRTCPVVRSSRTCAGWPRLAWSLGADGGSRSPLAPPRPRARLRRALLVQVPALFDQLQRAQGGPGGLAGSQRGGDDVGRRPTILSGAVACRRGRLGQSGGGLLGGFPAAATPRSEARPTRSGTAGRSRIWSDGERDEAAMNDDSSDRCGGFPPGDGRPATGTSGDDTSPR